MNYVKKGHLGYSCTILAGKVQMTYTESMWYKSLQIKHIYYLIVLQTISQWQNYLKADISFLFNILRTWYIQNVANDKRAFA